MPGHGSSVEKGTANNIKAKLFIQTQSYIYYVSTYAFVCLDFKHCNGGDAAPDEKKGNNIMTWLASLFHIYIFL